MRRRNASEELYLCPLVSLVQTCSAINKTHQSVQSDRSEYNLAEEVVFGIHKNFAVKCRRLKTSTVLSAREQTFALWKSSNPSEPQLRALVEV